MDTRSVTGLPLLHAETLGDNRVCIAILDGPVDLSHPCFHGADLRRLDTLVPDAAGNGPMSLHGTHVTSLLFGQPGSPIAGIAPQCRGLIVPIFRDHQEGRLSQLDLARAIEQAVGEGAHIINISGGQRSSTDEADSMLERALTLCKNNNVLVVAATGNDGCECLHVPAAVSSVLAVGAIGLDGKPLEISNWGEAYRSNGVLAPGQDIEGAAPGGGTASMTGSSFATPVVSGVAALLLSLQAGLGQPLDPMATGQAILRSAVPCEPQASPACRRYLSGTLNIAGALTSIKEGVETTVTNPDAADTLIPPADVGRTEPDMNATEPATAEVGPTGGLHAAGGESPPQLDSPPTPAVPAAATAITGVRASSGDCGCESGPKPLIFAIGNVGFDFGTEARRDSFRQLMPTVGDNELPPNPYDVVQLSDYLDNDPSESTELIWTLNLDLTPIYALEAKQSYADNVYRKLRAALRAHALPTDDEGYVSRVSIPGTLTGKTIRLFSGQQVPVVCVQPRGLYGWEESKLLDSAMDNVERERDDTSRATIRLAIQSFLHKIYYELRNLGQSAPDRALNYAGTNIFQLTQSLAGAILSARDVPGPSNNLYVLDTIEVVKSPYCRMDSDCWDVKITFFDPEEVRRAKKVLLYTIDVSDVMPVSLAPVHEYLSML
ncbi:MAG: PatA/PatG family cyanobactin maturation protease [Pseudonocardiaceae bacterium]